jgi:pilus assembly protein CpaE
MSDPLLPFAGIILLLATLVVLTVIWIVRRRRAGQVEESPRPARTRSVAAQQQIIDEDTEDDDSVVRPASSKPTPPPASTPSPPQKFSSPKPLSDDLESGNKIRILIVDDNTGTRDNVSRLLYFEKDLEVIGQAVNGAQGVEMTIKLKPHIVLMDINMPDMDGITATRHMAVEAPYSQVIIMSVQSDQHYMKQAMAAGARDFQPKPFTSEELVNCVRRVYKIGLPAYERFEMADKAKKEVAVSSSQAGGKPKHRSTGTPVIAVYSPKGGVGTSAIAANLAIALQQEIGDTVLLDADLQFGDVSVHLNVRPERTIGDLIHDNKLETDLIPEILMAHESGVKLMLAPPQPQLADIISGEMIKAVLQTLKDGFKVVVVDVAKQLTDKTLTVLETADHILVITKPELPSVKSAKIFLDTAEPLGLRDRVTLVINMATMPGAANLDKIEKVLKVDHSYQIPYDTKLHFALNNRGMSIYQQDSNAPSAKAIAGLAQALIEKLNIRDPELEAA